MLSISPARTRLINARPPTTDLRRAVRRRAGFAARLPAALYLALLLLYAGVALALNALGSLALLPVVVVWLHYGAVKHEEIRLAQLFGEEYAHYCRTTPRWW